MYPALLEEFKPDRQVGIFSGDRVAVAESKHYSSMATCIRSLLPLASLRIAVLDRCIMSLLALYYGRLHGDARLVEFARSSYTVALSQFSRQLESFMAKTTWTSMRSHQIFLCASMALQLFEHVSEIDVFGEGQLAHVDGALKFLHACGPKLLQKSPGMRMAFSGLRGVAVFVIIEQRVPNFLAEPDWLTVPFEGAEKSTKDRLNELGLEIPILLKSTDDLLSHVQSKVKAPARFVDIGLRLLNELAGLQRRFEEWLYAFKTSASGPLYWPRSQPTVNPGQRDTECQPKYTSNFHQLLFSCGPIAGLLTHCWSFQLQLLMTSIDLQQALLDRTSSIEQSESLSASKMLSNSLFKDHIAAEKTAQLILEAQPYLGSCFEGLLCLQSPLRIVARYFARTDRVSN